MNPVLTATGLAFLAVVGAILSASLRAHYRRAYLRPDASWLVVLRVMAVVLMVLGTGGLFLLGLFTLLMPLVVAATALFLVSFVHLRNVRRHQLLSLLAVAMRQQIPLAELMHEFAAETSGGIGRGAEKLAKKLDAGQSLTWSLRTGKLVRRWLLAMLVTGGQAGALPAAMEEAVTLTEPVPGDEDIAQTMAYFLSTLFVMLGILFFFVIKIAPEFVKIAKDFNSEVPALLKSTMDLAELPLIHERWWVGGIVALLIFLCGDGIVGVLPRFGQLRRRSLRGLILRSMALVVDAQQPVEQALQSLARSVPSWWIGWRLTRVACAIERGELWHVQLARHGVITRAEGAVLAAAERVNNLGWALRELAARNERMGRHRSRMQMKLAVPVMTLLLGVAAGWFAYGAMAFLYELIVRLT